MFLGKTGIFLRFFKNRAPVLLTHGCISNTKYGKQFPTNVTKTVLTWCQIFAAKMHQIRFRLGLHPRPR